MQLLGHSEARVRGPKSQVTRPHARWDDTLCTRATPSWVGRRTLLRHEPLAELVLHVGAGELRAIGRSLARLAGVQSVIADPIHSQLRVRFQPRRIAAAAIRSQAGRSAVTPDSASAWLSLMPLLAKSLSAAARML